MLNVDTQDMLLWHIKNDVLHDILHMTKPVTAMKAARAALVGFFLSILAWRVSRRRSTPTHMELILFYLCLFALCSERLARLQWLLARMQMTSASCRRNLWRAKRPLCSSQVSSTRCRSRVHPCEKSCQSFVSTEAQGKALETSSEYSRSMII